MQILLIAATELEIEPLKGNSTNMDILVTGVGIPSTIYHLQKRLNQISYNLVIQAGIAGSFDKGPALGETVLVQQDTFGDLGMEEKEAFQSIFDAGLADATAFPFSDGWLINTNTLIHELPFKKVKAITVNKLSDDILMMQQAINSFKPQIETMEGAALHYVCLQENIPFLQLRSISNHVGERDKTKWKLKEAIENLGTALTELLKRTNNA